mgnify:FL=1
MCNVDLDTERAATNIFKKHAQLAYDQNMLTSPVPIESLKPPRDTPKGASAPVLKRRKRKPKNQLDTEREAASGFIKHSRLAYRKDYGEHTLPSSSSQNRTCLEDALLNGLHASGNAGATKEHLRSMYNTGQNTPFTVAQRFIADNYAPLRLTRESPSFLEMKGGGELAILSCRAGLFILQLKVSSGLHDKDPDFHCVFFDASKGLILDNYGYSKVLEIEDSDRQDKHTARRVFNSLFRGLVVQVINVYQLK